ncbi:MAG: flagellar motor switch phosphatase FliY [Symbiobacteriia bacterium]
MSNESLSQAEIDALLNSGGRNAAEAAESPFTPEEERLLDERLVLAGSASAGALGTLVGEPAQISPPAILIATPEQVLAERPSRFVVAKVEYIQGLAGASYYLLSEMDALAIADLLLGGDGRSAEELGESQQSALGEALSQMAGAAATSLSDALTVRIFYSPPEVFTAEAATGLFSTEFPADGPLVVATSRLLIGDVVDGDLVQILSLELARRLGSAADGPAVAAAPVPSVAPAPRPAQPPAPAFAGAPASGFAATSVAQGVGPAAPQATVAVQAAAFPDLGRQGTASDPQNIDLIMDVPLQVTVELGRTRKRIREVLALGPGSVVELDKLAGEAVDVLVNGKLVAKGEVVVIDENFGVRITDIVSPAERVRSL